MGKNKLKYILPIIIGLLITGASLAYTRSPGGNSISNPVFIHLDGTEGENDPIHNQCLPSGADDHYIRVGFSRNAPQNDDVTYSQNIKITTELPADFNISLPEGNYNFVFVQCVDFYTNFGFLPGNMVVTLEYNNNGVVFSVVPEKKQVVAGIDIKPGSYPNSINLGSGGVVPVAIFSTLEFDATTIDPITVTLANAPVQLRGNGTPMASFRDVNGDGLLDLVIHISTQALQLSSTDQIANLSGYTFDNTIITGSDTVRVMQ